MNIHELGEALDALDQSISLLKSALATVDLQMQVLAGGFEAFEKNTKKPMSASLAAKEKTQPSPNQAEFKAPVMPEMPAMPTPSTTVTPPDTKTDPTKLPSEGPNDSDFTLAIAKMSRNYNGFLGGEVQRTLAWYGIEPPNGVLSVPLERRYEFLDALEANAKEEAAS